jgi:hypothetical protein
LFQRVELDCDLHRLFQPGVPKAKRGSEPRDC